MSTKNETTEISFLDAVRGRYGAEDDIDTYDASAFLVGEKGRKKNKTWELVGMEKTRAKQSRYDRLVNVALKNESISVAVKASERRDGTAVREGEKEAYIDDLAAQRMVSLKELDLSENTKLPLDEVAKLLPYFPRLETLQLCDMPDLLPSFSTSVSGASSTAPMLSSQTLRKLVLNNAGFTSMVQLRTLLDLPNLEELHLDASQLANLVIAASAEEEAFLAAKGGESWLAMASVHTLSLARNAICSWEKLGDTIPKAFPGLQKLYLTDNKLPDLLLSDEVIAAAAAVPMANEAAPSTTAHYSIADVDASVAQAYRFLKPLTLLCLNENSTLTNTRTVDAIRVLCPHLEVFRITYSDLLQKWNDTLSRMFVVASLPTIQLLNRGQVRPKERLDSEIFYIQRGLAQREAVEAARKEGGEAAANTAKEAFKDEPVYPLLDLLKEKHKDLVLAIYKAGATASSDGSSHLMLDVRLRCDNNYKHTGNGRSIEDEAPSMFNEVRKTLPSSLPISKLKALIKVAFQVDPQNQKLSYRTGDDGVLERPVEMSNEMQTLAYYGVSNGAIISVTDTSLR